jgi:hypothetical protein
MTMLERVSASDRNVKKEIRIRMEMTGCKGQKTACVSLAVVD